jgi:hypothetical protein
LPGAVLDAASAAVGRRWKMPPLTDEETLAKYKEVLADWKFSGFVQWKPRAAEELQRHLRGYTQKAIAELMYKHRDAVDQTPETRDEYRHRYSHHYDFRIGIGGQRIYIETVLDYAEDDSTIVVVNIKPA